VPGEVVCFEGAALLKSRLRRDDADQAKFEMGLPRVFGM
jgi:hypothetical protein